MTSEPGCATLFAVVVLATSTFVIGLVWGNYIGSRVREDQAIHHGYGELIQTSGTRTMEFRWKDRK